MAQKSIMVHHEWGALREVVVGVPNIRLPTKLAEAPKRFLPEEAIKFIEDHPGQRLEECAPELNKKFEYQVNKVIARLRERNIIVHQVKKHNLAEEAFLAEKNDTVMQTYVRDIMLVIGDRFIETAMYEPNRRRELFAIRRTLRDRLAESNTHIISMPQPEPFPEPEPGPEPYSNGSNQNDYGPGPFLESGDVMLVGRDIYVGNTGNASNTAGIQWLRNHLGESYRVHEIRLEKKFLHLDCVLALPRPGVAVICEEGFPDGIPDFLKDWNRIRVTPKDAKEKLGCNGLVLDDRHMMIGSDMIKQIGGQLNDAGITPIPTDLDAITWQGGGLRCWHHPLVRESKL